ncbi:uncharacterized protein LOC111712951 [Eurytemora carolleeae]|uniref:uncharacterized protein LOC111712951 n=1 Tax=Eurytemora carolleeae TaxID=1294199 RepID=UPI000C7834EE|nr:uncharacterized protein LOC111712951 [Eurytemora carolleeae]|eukprot:XP_023343480.1 uncharacterized protein LOC111712951 [Eurytemora affinis]
MTAYCLFVLFFGLVNAGIEIPRDNCDWRGAHWGDFIACDGDQIAIGACGSGKDGYCLGSYYTAIQCCTFDGFYYGGCEVANSIDWGVPVSCVGLNGQNHLVESLCGSGGGKDCDGHSHETKCCVGHVEGKVVGTTGSCDWKYTSVWSEELTCGRADEAVMGICGSGENKDCPGDSVHGIYCCELVEIA